MKMNKKTIALLSTLAFAANAHGMWPSLSADAIKKAASSALETTSAYAQGIGSGIAGYASAARPAVSSTCQKALSKIKENKGSIGFTAAVAGLVYGGVKAYRSYTAQPEIAQAAALIDQAARNEAQLSDEEQAAIQELVANATANVVANKVPTDVASSANSSSVELVVPATEYVVMVTEQGNTLKVVFNEEEDRFEFCLVDALGDKITYAQEFLSVRPHVVKTTNNTYWIGTIENLFGEIYNCKKATSAQTPVDLMVSNLKGEVVERRYNIFNS